MIQKKKRISIFAIVVGSMFLIVSVVIIMYKLQPPHTFEILNTRIYYETGYIGDERLFVNRYCMSINPPQSESQILDLMLDYCRDNKDSLENIGDYQTKMKIRVYNICFYRETLNFRRTWQPYEKDNSDLELTEYGKYLLGSVYYYSEGDENVIVTVDKRNDIHNATTYTLKKSDVFK